MKVAVKSLQTAAHTHNYVAVFHRNGSTRYLPDDFQIGKGKDFSLSGSSKCINSNLT